MIYLYYKKKKIVLFLLLKTIVMFFLCVVIMSKSYCVMCNNDSVVPSNTRRYPQSTRDQQLKQLTQISDAHSQCLIQLQQQLSDNQQDLEKLRGQIQNIQHHIAEIVHNQKESCKKFDQILNTDTQTQYDYNNVKQLSSTDNVKIDFSNENAKKSVVNTVDSDYKIAVKLVLEKKQYIQAIQAFQDFIKKYPKSHYHPNAHYWLGQLYYNQGNKHDASYHFALVVKDYGKSSKAPDALLKIGIIMQETNQIDKAKTIYRQVGKLYPNSDASKQAQKRLLRLS